MLVTVLRPTMIAGERVDAGFTLDLEPATANMLIGTGKAIFALAAPATAAEEAESIEAVEPPKPTRSARKSTQPAPLAP